MQMQLENIQYMIGMTVSARDVSNLINQLKCACKAARSDDSCARYFKFAHDKCMHYYLCVFQVVFYTLLSASIND